MASAAWIYSGVFRARGWFDANLNDHCDYSYLWSGAMMRTSLCLLFCCLVMVLPMRGQTAEAGFNLPPTTQWVVRLNLVRLRSTGLGKYMVTDLLEIAAAPTPELQEWIPVFGPLFIQASAVTFIGDERGDRAIVAAIEGGGRYSLGASPGG